MDIKLIRHDSRLQAIWINTTDINLATEIATKFLKSIETIDFYYVVGTCKIWAKDNSLIKVEYQGRFKKESPYFVELQEINNRMYSLIIKNNLTNKSQTFTDTLSVIGEKIQGYTLNRKSEMTDLKIGQSLNFNYYDEFEGEISDIEYTATRLS